MIHGRTLVDVQKYLDTKGSGCGRDHGIVSDGWNLGTTS
jgi:hypothetical protein